MEQLAKNQLHTAEITGYTSDGAGVCHIAGRAVFVKGALAGETWQVRILLPEQGDLRRRRERRPRGQGLLPRVQP